MKKHVAKYTNKIFIYVKKVMKKIGVNHFNELRIYFISLIFLSQFFFIYAQDTIYLEKDTFLWTTGSKVNFIANSMAETNEQNKIISGFINETH